MLNKQTTAQVVLPLLFVMTATTTFAQQSDKESEQETTTSPVVTVIQAAMGEVETRISVSGTLVAAEEVLVNTRINGYAIENIQVEIGDAVDAGSVLATLDESSAASSLAQAEAELMRADAAIGQAQSQIDASVATASEAASNLKRNQRLRDSGTISAAALEQARASANSARANTASARDGLAVAQAQRTSAESQRDMAKLTLDRTRITAPVAGIVSARDAQLGEIASGGGEPLFRIIRDGALEIAVDVVETSLAGLDAGDEANLNVAGVGEVTGSVRLISPTVDAVTRLGAVRLSLPNNPALKAGLSASGWIITDRYQSIIVPASAVLTQGLKSHVQLVVDGLVETREVVAGVLSADGSREILEGLEVGEQVVARAGAFFIDGDAVRVVSAKAESGVSAEENQ